MADRTIVMSWLEGLAQDDWRMYHSDSEVQEIAQYALALLKESESIVRCKDCGYGLETGTTSWIQCSLPFSGAPLRDINYYCADGIRK